MVQSIQKPVPNPQPGQPATVYVVGHPDTDRRLEASLDLMEFQVLRRLADDPDPMCVLFRRFVRIGYASRGRPSPYIWAGTDQYVSGKYVRDGVYDPNAVDQQLGCAGMLLAMMQIDSSIKFGAAAATAVVKATGQAVVPAHPDSAPSITHPAPGSLCAWIASFFRKPGSRPSSAKLHRASRSKPKGD